MGTELSLYLTIKINLSICPISLPSFLVYLFVFPLTVNYLHYNTFISLLMYIMTTKSSYKGKKIYVMIHTVDSHYLEIQGTLWNTSRLPYFDISDLWNRGKQLIEQPPLTEWICNLTPKLEIYWKCGKEEKLLLRSNFSSFPQYFVAC